METVAIVGANVAGGRAAETLRAEGFDGRIVLVDAERERPYERPPLSKELLRGEQLPETVFLRSRDFYEQQEIELRLGQRVERVDVAQATVLLASGERLPYGKLLICTGVAPRKLTIPGEALEGVFYLRTLQDAQRLASALTMRPRVLVLGTGFIGCEVAASARSMGCEVVLLGPKPPMCLALGGELAQFYTDYHRARGVDVRVGDTLVKLGGAQRVEAALTSSDETISCDLVVAGIGVTPAIEFLAGEPVAVDNGVVTDDFAQTSAPNVFAAGDVANWWHPRWQTFLRVEHFDHAQHHGIAAAKSMLGKGQPYAPIPFFWTEQFGLNLQYVGHGAGWSDIVFRGKLTEDAFSAFYLRNGRLIGCAAVNRFKDIAAAKLLLKTDTPVTAELLVDDTVDLRQLAITPSYS